MKTYPRNSRSAVHAICMVPAHGYECSTTEKHIQNRSGGATTDPARISCEVCRYRVISKMNRARRYEVPEDLIDRAFRLRDRDAFVEMLRIMMSKGWGQ